MKPALPRESLPTEQLFGFVKTCSKGPSATKYPVSTCKRSCTQFLSVTGTKIYYSHHNPKYMPVLVSVFLYSNCPVSLPYPNFSLHTKNGELFQIPASLLSILYILI